MTPCHIVDRALERGVQMIAVTDHNSTLQGPEIKAVGAEKGLMVICGAEVTTKEEVHCLALVGTEPQRVQLQEYLEAHLPHIPNNPDVFGYQFQIDRNEEVVAEAPYLLISALDRNIEQIESFVHSIGGLFIPAHINKMRDSVLSQLGFLPPDLKVDALELSRHVSVESFLQQNKYLKNHFFLQSSDAHLIEDVGCISTLIEMDTVSFEGLKAALTKHTVQ